MDSELVNIHGQVNVIKVQVDLIEIDGYMY
jgi:hypothetical protein